MWKAPKAWILPLALGLIPLASCSDSNGKISWYFHSDTSTGAEPIKGGLVLTWSNSSKTIRLVSSFSSSAPEASPFPIALHVHEREIGGKARERDLYLATQGDAVLRQEGGRITLHSPCLEGGSMKFPERSTVKIAPDSATLFRIESPVGDRVHVSAFGDLCLLEDPGGIRARTRKGQMHGFKKGTRISASGRGFVAREIGGRSTFVLAPTARDIGSQMSFVSSRKAIRFFTPQREVSAELPSASFEVRDGTQGIVLFGRFPDGLSGALAVPFQAVLPSRNSNLLVLRGLRD